MVAWQNRIARYRRLSQRLALLFWVFAASCPGWECELIIEGGAEAPEAVRCLTLEIPVEANAAELVESREITKACCIAQRENPTGPITGRLSLTGDEFSFDPDSCSLGINLCCGANPVGPLPPGFYHIRLCGDFLLMGMPKLASEDLVTDSAGSSIKVDAYSVPSLADWNTDGLPDLLVGSKSGTGSSTISVWLNAGTLVAPLFVSSFPARTVGKSPIAIPSSGCLGVFPRFLDWDRDGLSDLLVGTADGRMTFWKNVGGVGQPVFEAGADVEAGDGRAKSVIDVGSRATFDVADWDGDGIADLIAGSLDGKIRIFLNTSATGLPDLSPPLVLAGPAGSEFVASARSSPCLYDFDNDGLSDLISGNTDGQLLFYRNQGTVGNPQFQNAFALEAGNAAIDLPGTPRSRPWLGDFNGDGICDVLLGAQDGFIRIYAGRATENPLPGAPRLGIEETVCDMTGNPLLGGEYSTPTMADMNSDGLPDMISGEKSPTGTGNVRLWLNEGTREAPAFGPGHLVRSGPGPLEVAAGGCLGVYARAYDWNDDDRPDLVLGLADGGAAGSFEVWLDSATDGEPDFSRLGRLEVGPEGSEEALIAGRRATFAIADLNGDGIDDFVFGELYGSVSYCPGRVSGSDLPAFSGPVALTSLAELFPAESSADPNVGRRSSVSVVDFNDDGLPDILSGNTSGWLIACPNSGTPSAPQFSSGLRLECGCGLIDLDGDPRSRPWAGDFDADGHLDIVLGARDGLIRLYRGSPWEGCFERDFAVLGIDGPATAEVVDTAAFSVLPLDPSCTFTWTLPDVRQEWSGPSADCAFMSPGHERIVVEATLPDGSAYRASKSVEVVHRRNHAPKISGTVLTSLGEGIIEVVGEDWWDYEGAPEQYSYEWFLNGERIDGETGATFDMSVIPANALLHCTVTPVNEPVKGKPADPTVPVSEACAAVFDLDDDWSLVYPPSGKAATARSGAVWPPIDRGKPHLSTRGLWTQTPGPELRCVETFAAGQGFWARGDSSRSGPTLFIGRRTSVPTGWESGWRIVGVAETTSSDDVMLSGLPRAEVSLWAWDKSCGTYAPVPLGTPLIPGVGYWGCPRSTDR